MATTITLPNGVRIDTTDDGASLREAFATIGIFDATSQQIAAVAPATQEPKAPKAQAAPKPKASSERRGRSPKGNGKALWASITTAITEGDYAAARSLAESKPDTFGVQAEAAIQRHMAKQAKASKMPQAQAPKEPKAAPKEPKKASLPPKGEQTTVVRITPKVEAAKIDAKVRKAHKPGCGCVTCPEGVKARKAKAAKPPTQPKADAPKAETKPAPKSAPTVPADEAAMERECSRVLEQALQQAEAMATHGDLEGLRKATSTYLSLANRNERLDRSSLYEAYKDAADLCDDALTEVKASLASIS